ncbi:hypothetical protein L3Y34_009684 [Caenorhabditis briggsae]|uniref:Glycosyltransferase family 92 protein n=1 Tax=Caenorhabditis briggsae TaxID=6238 RepID=A0AAE9A6N4_CAEBR|nr:hypothetical protein L3Y34_009684 [Caenorhabditis briggsae]
MRFLLITLLILYNLPLTNTTSIYEFSQPEYRIGKNHTVQIWEEIGTPDPNRTDVRFLFHSSKFGFKNPNFIQNVSDFLMDNAFSTFNLIADATDDILENSEHFSNFSEKSTLWIVDFQSKDYVKIFPQFEIRQLSCDEFGSFENFRDNRYFQKFDLLLLETNSQCGLSIHEEISKKSDFILQSLAKNIDLLLLEIYSFCGLKIQEEFLQNSDFILQNLALKWKFYDIILLETVETTNYTYSPYPEYREELLNLEKMKKQRYFQNIYIDALHEMSREFSDSSSELYPTNDFSIEQPVLQ